MQLSLTAGQDNLDEVHLVAVLGCDFSEVAS